MNFDLSETQELFRATTERFTQKIDVSARTQIRSNASGYDRARWSELCELGLLTVVATEEQGGLEGSLTDLCVVAETMGRNNALDPWLENGFFPAFLLSEADETHTLKHLLSGSKMAAVAFAEPDSRYASMPHQTTASKVNKSDCYRLTGEKHFVMGGGPADILLTTALCDNKFSIFCVHADHAELETQEYRLADGSVAARISMKDLELPSSARINLDESCYRDAITRLCVLACSEMLGLSQLVFDQTLSYVKERKQFNVPIGSFQVIQHGLVDCYTQLEQMRSLLLRTLLVAQGSTENWHASVMGTKSFISDSASFIAERAIQFHGAMGITDELDIGHAYKRIILLSRLFGDSSKNIKEYMECA